METVVFDQSPLAEYLKDEGDEHSNTWAPAVDPDQNIDIDTPPPSPPATNNFAPVGRPLVKKQFRKSIANSLRVKIPRSTSLSSSINNSYSRALASRIDRADNSKFLEQFRYTIIASQLLSGHSVLGFHQPSHDDNTASNDEPLPPAPTSTGLIVTAVAALAFAWTVSWVRAGGLAYLSKKRVLVSLAVLVLTGALGHAFIRQRWLRYIRECALGEVTSFVRRSQDYDSATSAAVALVQEVELVSRGYRISVPLPPITRIEDRSQSRKCVRLRKALKACFADTIEKYLQTAAVIKGFAEQMDLEKYYDIYDLSDLDMSDALQGFSDTEFEDAESLRALKIAAARFHTLRKMFLCALLALEANGDNSDFLRWTTAVEGLRVLNEAAKNGYERLRIILSEGETFPSIQTPKMPLSPNRERWRSQLRKLNSLSSGIRGLQAKLALLREESDRSLNEADDVSQLAPNLMAQYDSIGQDLRMLTQAWEEGRSALASGIDRNEKRLSSISGLLSPTISLGGLTSVEDGGAAEALKALTGESSPSPISSPRDPVSEEIFEAVAMPRPRSMFSREDRIAKMKEERERKAEMREAADANRGMLRELEMVINLRPNRPKSTDSPSTPGGRLSM